MKSQDDSQQCGSHGRHEWQPLFSKPYGAKYSREFLAKGYADLMQCSNCGVVGIVDGSAHRKVYLFSESMAGCKKRIAVIWNARMAEAEQQASEGNGD